MKKHIVLVLFSCSLFACEQAEINTPVLENPDNRVQLANLKPGQQSQYVHYFYECGLGDTAFSWSGDTLNLRVIEENGELFFEETYTPLSPRFQLSPNQEPVVYPVSMDNGDLIIPERWESQLFYFYGNDRISLTYLLDARPPVFQDGCRLTLADIPFEGNEIAHINTFDLMDIHQRDKTVVSCVPVQIALEAYLFYDFNQLYLSHTYDHWAFMDDHTVSVHGWQLIETD